MSLAVFVADIWSITFSPFLNEATTKQSFFSNRLSTVLVPATDWVEQLLCHIGIIGGFIIRNFLPRQTLRRSKYLNGHRNQLCQKISEGTNFLYPRRICRFGLKPVMLISVAAFRYDTKGIAQAHNRRFSCSAQTKLRDSSRTSHKKWHRFVTSFAFRLCQNVP